jgi:signal transduction histidine kinase
MANIPATELANDNAPAWWRYGRTLVAPLMIWALLMAALWQTIPDWLDSERNYDRAVLQEWIDETRNADNTLAELVGEYARAARTYLSSLKAGKQDGKEFFKSFAMRERLAVKREEIYQSLRALGEPPTKMYPGQLPLFPVIYRLEVQLSPQRFENIEHWPADDGPKPDDAVIWDSGQEPSSGRYHEVRFPLRDREQLEGEILIRYQLRAWNKQQRDEQLKSRRVRLLALLALGATILATAWMLFLQADERERQRQRQQTRDALAHAKEQQLERERSEAEMQRELLSQRLATREAERKALELKSNLFASIGIMAGSYAHNIKNLLVRPNDLLRRCLERAGNGPELGGMLGEVQQTLGTVTERLEQILQTVRRDPSLTQLSRMDLNKLVGSLERTWRELARDRWQLDLEIQPCAGELMIAGDESHLQQAIENLLFNARDATYEMRNHIRQEAYRSNSATLRQALLAATAWRGRVVVTTHREAEGTIVLRVIDNGNGMTEEVRQRCTETHFTTKRDNALYEGLSAGMGLGLSFVGAILENHRAEMKILSKPHHGATFEIRFKQAVEEPN